jgi:tetratricopeptide (TPR) repeat protein
VELPPRRPQQYVLPAAVLLGAATIALVLVMGDGDGDAEPLRPLPVPVADPARPPAAPEDPAEETPPAPPIPEGREAPSLPPAETETAEQSPPAPTATEADGANRTPSRGRDRAPTKVQASEAPSPPIETETVAASPRDLTREGTTAYVQGRMGDAVESYRQALRVSPSYAPAWRGLGLAHQRLGNRAEARRAFERYLQLAPEANDVPQIRERLSQLQ